MATEPEEKSEVNHLMDGGTIEGEREEGAKGTGRKDKRNG